MPIEVGGRKGNPSRRDYRKESYKRMLRRSPRKPPSRNRTADEYIKEELVNREPATQTSPDNKQEVVKEPITDDRPIGNISTERGSQFVNREGVIINQSIARESPSRKQSVYLASDRGRRINIRSNEYKRGSSIYVSDGVVSPAPERRNSFVQGSIEGVTKPASALKELSASRSSLVGDGRLTEGFKREAGLAVGVVGGYYAGYGGGKVFAYGTRALGRAATKYLGEKAGLRVAQASMVAGTAYGVGTAASAFASTSGEQRSNVILSTAIGGAGAVRGFRSVPITAGTLAPSPSWQASRGVRMGSNFRARRVVATREQPLFNPTPSNMGRGQVEFSGRMFGATVKEQQMGLTWNQPRVQRSFARESPVGARSVQQAIRRTTGEPIPTFRSGYTELRTGSRGQVIRGTQTDLKYFDARPVRVTRLTQRQATATSMARSGGLMMASRSGSVGVAPARTVFGTQRSFRIPTGVRNTLRSGRARISNLRAPRISYNTGFGSFPFSQYSRGSQLSVLRELNMQTPNYASNTISPPPQDLGSTPAYARTPAIAQTPQYSLRESTIQDSALTQQFFTSSTPSRTPTTLAPPPSPPTPPPPPPAFPPVPLGGGIPLFGVGNGGGNKKKRGREFSYAPSLTSVYYDIRGQETKIISGFETRKVTNKKRTRKKRR